MSKVGREEVVVVGLPSKERGGLTVRDESEEWERHMEREIQASLSLGRHSKLPLPFYPSFSSLPS